MTQKTIGRAVYLSLGTPHLEYPEVEKALKAYGVDAQMVHLDEIDRHDLDTFDLVNLRMCRGYHKFPDFMQRIEKLHHDLERLPGGRTRLVNNIALVRDAADKGRYLRRLEEDGVELIPTRWLSRGSATTVDAIMRETGWDDLVIKPTVSSGSWQTVRVSREECSTSDSHFILPRDAEAVACRLEALLLTRDVCVQQFFPSVIGFGELSFVFLGGEFSHAVRKTVGSDGGWWAHERLGGVNYTWLPDARELEWATDIHRLLVERYGWLWFGRVDGIRDRQGQLRLLECELAIPRLLLPEGGAFDRYAQAVSEGIRRHSQARTAV